jgi:pilus assembly protein CpaE
MTLKLFDIAEKIVLVANPTIPSIRNARKMLDIFDNLEKPSGLSDKVLFVLNRVVNEKERGHGTVPTASIENHLKHKVVGAIPLDERSVLTSVNQGVPLVAKQKSRSPGKELVTLAEFIRQTVETEEAPQPATDQRSKSGIRAIFGGTS